MKKLILILLFTPLILFGETSQDQQIIQNIISESIANYSGNCPCPYNRAANGSSCGRRSVKEFKTPLDEDTANFQNEVFA